jgi:adenylate kinase
MKRRVVLLGPPGSGKGTVAPRLEERFGLEHLSTGQWFRKEVQTGSALGEQVREYIANGRLVPDRIVLGLLEHWLTPDLMQRGYLLDGFPRTCAQAVALDDFCDRNEFPVEIVLFMDLPPDLIVERITGRRTCPTCGAAYHVRNLPPLVSGKCDKCGSALIQREDDTAEVVNERLQFYQEVTEPVVEHYRASGKLVRLDAALGSEQAVGEAEKVLAS